MTVPNLAVEHLSVGYQRRDAWNQVLSDVSLTVEDGEILGIVGESGCGKSTLALAVLGLLPSNARVLEGHIRLQGTEMSALSEEDLRRARGRRIGAVFQDPLSSLNPTLTVGQQMMDAIRAHPELAPQSPDGPRGDAIAALRSVGLAEPERLLKRYPHQLSGGMRQRVTIAIVLLLRPSMLLMDEPTASLDVTLEAQVVNLVRDIRASHNLSIVFVSHDLGVISSVSDRVAVLYAGQVVEVGSTESVLAAPRHPYTSALIGAAPSFRKRAAKRLATVPGDVPTNPSAIVGCRFAARCPLARTVCQTDAPKLIVDGDTEIRCHVFDPASGWADAPPARVAESEEIVVPILAPSLSADVFDDQVLAVEDLHVAFSNGISWFDRAAPTRAVDGVSITLGRGEIYGLIGESGSGKTTVARSIVGLIEPDGGTIRVGRASLVEANGRGSGRRGSRAQMVFQDAQASLSPRQSVRYLLEEPYVIHKTPQAERIPVEELLASVGLGAIFADRFPHQLSGGQARRVAIARALALRPDVIVADEPTAGLDISAAASILNLMRDLARDHGVSYLIITHNLNLVAYVANRIGVMYLGRIIESAPTEAIFTAARHPYTRALLRSIAEVSGPLAAKAVIEGEIPGASAIPSGCRFHTRCPFAQAVCSEVQPLPEAVTPSHTVECHFHEEVARSGTDRA